MCGISCWTQPSAAATTRFEQTIVFGCQTRFRVAKRNKASMFVQPSTHKDLFKISDLFLTEASPVPLITMVHYFRNRSFSRIVDIPDSASESDVAGGCVDRLRVACSRPVSATVVRCAQMRPALQDFSCDLDSRLTGIVAIFLRTTPRIPRDAACLGRIRPVL